jgi:hypothetical protein
LTVAREPLLVLGTLTTTLFAGRATEMSTFFRRKYTVTFTVITHGKYSLVQMKLSSA